ncbi:MAG: DoxX family protein [Candidatus Margulisiibacteriota bacterium]
MNAVRQTITTLFRYLSKHDYWILALIRLSLGLIFVQTGFGKFTHFPDTVAFFADLGIPFASANAAIATTIEFVGGIALILGLFTRLFGLALTGVMVVAIVTAQWANIHSLTDGIMLQEWDYILFFLLLVIRGAGKWSLDERLSRRSTHDLNN